MHMREKVELKAVYESDLQNVLTQLGILNAIIAGEIQCVVCGETVDLDNLGTICVSGGEVSVSCDKDLCVRTITTSRETS
jgi:hypothetical protein